MTGKIYRPRDLKNYAGKRFGKTRKVREGMFGEIDEKIRHEWALKLVKKLVGAPTVENASLLADLYDSAESEWLVSEIKNGLIIGDSN